MHYYQFNIGDYRRDTSHLIPIEHYIYRTLIDWYYLDESPIPKETQTVSRRLGLASEWLPNLQNVLDDFFQLGENGWLHKRIEDEIGAYRELCEKNKVNAKLGGRPKKTQSVSSGIPVVSLTNNQEPITNNIDTNVSIVRNEVADCPHEEIIKLYAKHLPMLPQIAKWTTARSKLLKTRWREDKKRQSLEWWNKFFLYVSKSPFLTGNESGRHWQSDIDWILKEANFIKIIEGKYHGTV